MRTIDSGGSIDNDGDNRQIIDSGGTISSGGKTIGIDGTIDSGEDNKTVLGL